MPNWLASELCMVTSFGLGAWKTFKVLKHGGTDYNLLKTWCLLGLLRVFEEYFEILVSWIPFYWLGKCAGLALLFIPDGNISSVVFHRVVVYGMDHAHHVLNNFVVPGVVEFVVFLPWKLLLVLFPTLPAPPSPSSSSSSSGGGNTRLLGRPPGGSGGGGGGLGSRLEHLKMPEDNTAAGGSSIDTGGGRRRVSPRRGAGDGTAAAAGLSTPPPLPQRDPPREPTDKNETDGIATDGDVVRNGAPVVESMAQISEELPTLEVTAAATPARYEEGGEAVDGSSRSQRRRRSFGEIVRTAITGNSNVRLRDHLFDLGTASPAPLAPPPNFPTTPAAAADGNGSDRGQRHLRELSRKLSDESTNDAAAAGALPPVSDNRADRQPRRASITLGTIEPVERSSPLAKTRSKDATRRRPSEFSRNIRGGGGGGGSSSGGGGGDAAGGGSSDGPNRGVRRRSSSGRQAPDKNGHSRSVHPGGGSDRFSAASNRPSSAAAAGSSVRGDSAEARARRLSEWRKRRADQAEAQLRERPRRTSRTAAAAGVSADSAVRGATAGYGSSQGSAGSGSGRRFRHVERFRSEMAKTLEPTGDVAPALPARPSRDGAGGRPR